MKVYLAAPYSKKDEIKAYANELAAAGVTVTSSWLDEPHKPTTLLSNLSHETNQKYAIQDLRDLQEADAMVFFTDPTKTIVRAGRHVEFGFMLGLSLAREVSIPIIVVGFDYENIFHYLPGIEHFDTWGQAKLQVLMLAQWVKGITSNLSSC